jgi:hypothetical protein
VLIDLFQMTPNAGQGGNAAVESAASLTNHLVDLLKKQKAAPSIQEIEATLQQYEESRAVRIKAIWKMANQLSRLHSFESTIHKFMATQVLPRSGDFFIGVPCDNAIGAEKLECLPDPERSLGTNMPFNKRRGRGQEDKKLPRALLAGPILLIAIICAVGMFSMMLGPLLPILENVIATREIPGSRTKLGKEYFGPLHFLNEMFQPMIISFCPSILGLDALAQMHGYTFFADLAPLYLIMILEANRRANVLGFPYLCVIWGIAMQIFGGGVIAPLYFFLHYVYSPVSVFAASDQRLITMGHAKTALLALVLGYCVPTIGMFFAPSEDEKISWNAIWQLFPILVSFSHSILAQNLVTDDTKQARLAKPPTADLWHVKASLYSVTLISALVFNYVRFASPSTMKEILLPTWWLSSDASLKHITFTSGILTVYQIDYICLFGSALAWLLLLHRDLKVEEVVQYGSIVFIGWVTAGLVLIGPGATLALAWLVREKAIATTPAKGSVVRAKQVSRLKAE